MSLSLIIWNVLRCVWNLLNPGLRLLREKTAHTLGRPWSLALTQ